MKPTRVDKKLFLEKNMNKKIFGIRIATILQFLLCLVFAAIIWFVVQYANMQDDSVNAEAYDSFIAEHLL